MIIKRLVALILIIIIIILLTANGYTQEENTPYVGYSFKVDGVDEYIKAKPIWNDIRYFFNYENDPFRYRLDLNGGVFNIVIPRELNEQEIMSYFNSKNINLTELNIYYYE